ncbi:MAG: Hsp33 family molecular chaperone HslO [Cytophagales bacterium]|nr:Hsp33 family molecular chaperone HslO [Cytophagales bacterium]
MSELHTFIFEGLPVRGVIVRLTDDWQQVLSRGHNYPAVVEQMLGEMTAAAVLMHSNIKWNGSLILQVMGSEKKDESPVKLAVVEVKSDLTFRTTAKLVHAVKGDESFHQLINASNRARCAITLDPEMKFQGQQAYQSVVPLWGDHGEPLASFALAIEHYMLQSEQLDTKMVLAADSNAAVGILIQRIPIKGENNLAGTRATFERSSTEDEDAIGQSEDFNRIALLTQSIKREELLSLSVDDILHRLFWNEPIARYAPAHPAPRFQCTCSRERVASTIRSLGQTEAERMIEETEGIQVSCDFCGQTYRFDGIDAAMLFMPAESVVPPKI